MKNIEYYENLGVFTADQMQQIRLGLEYNFDVSPYAKTDFNCGQMRQTRLGLKDNKNKKQ